MMQDLDNLTLHLSAIFLAKFHDQLTADVRGHDQDGVLEINGPALPVRHPAVIHYLQQDIKHIRMGLFDLVE